MRKLLLLLSIVGLFSFSNSTFGQLLDEKNVTITMDLQPVLQLSMTTPDHIEFVFNDIRQYYAGIVKYGATALKVSASVSWDLWAVGHSQTGTSYWDQAVNYGQALAANTNSVASLPLSALELHQTPSNIRTTGVASGGKYADYRNAFQTTHTGVAITSYGKNSIYVSGADPYRQPTTTDKFIYGQAGQGTGSCGKGGSWLNQYTNVNTAIASAAWGTDYYYFSIDYRILPGLPAVFTYAGDNAGATNAINAGSYAQPGVYSMNVKYLLMEDF